MISELVVGIDIGGTNIKTALVNSEGKAKHFYTMPTNAEDGAERILVRVCELVNSYKKNLHSNETLIGVGLALPGSVDNISGVCLFSPNLKWQGVKVASSIRKVVDLPVKVINDANAACLGEFFFGAGKNCSYLICITIGTGIGSGIVLENKLYIGKCGYASEAGHMVIVKDGPECSCGRRGCLEALVSATAIVKRMMHKIDSGVSTVLADMAAGNPELITTENIIAAAALKDQAASEIVAETTEFLAIGLANLANIFNPEKIILGGGVINEQSIFLTGLEEKVKQYTYPTLREPLDIERAELGNQAGLIGAASYFLKKINTIGG